MGQHERQQEMWVEPINLGKLIPDDDPLRKINRVLKLDFVREGTPWDAYEIRAASAAYDRSTAGPMTFALSLASAGNTVY